MEIERKFLVNKLPESLSLFEKHQIRQAYLCTDPVIRVRQKDDDYILTLKGSGMIAREEVEMPLSKEAFDNLYKKTEGISIAKTRYIIPAAGGLVIELDRFEAPYQGLVLAEVEFPDLGRAEAYKAPAWFGREVTTDPRFFNSALSSNSPEEAAAFIRLVCHDPDFAGNQE